MEVTKPYEFIGFGAMEVTKSYEFIGFGAMEVTKPYEFMLGPYTQMGDGRSRQVVPPQSGPKHRPLPPYCYKEFLCRQKHSHRNTDYTD